MPWWSTGIGTRTCVALLYPIFAGEVSGRSVQVVYVKHSFYFLSYYILLLPVRTGGVCLCGGAPGSGCSERPSASPSPCHLVNAPRHLADSPSCWLSARPLALGGVACRPGPVSSHVAARWCFRVMGGSFVYLSDRHVMCSARTAAATLRDARTSFQQDDSVWTPELRFGVLKANRR
jgi:hypothetical protein|uniref:Uncharacterized protein n=1 Tax=Zea mays TaxID=4577 RepID=B4FCZ3_MAIZE|nr:unknown [Zea mays]ACG27204.1 hypothetical protein [Zea mays]|eukprot:NP_001131542.1 uncharacterized protein LOC100192882 isoform 2 [Zea mays]